MFEYLNDHKKNLGLAFYSIIIGLIFGFLLAYLTAEPKPSIKEVKFDENFKALLTNY